MELYFSPSVKNQLRKLKKKDPKLRKRLDKSFIILKRNPRHPSLRLHKLQGLDNYSISAGMDIRIIFQWEDDKVFLLEIGSHDQVY